MRRVYLFVFSEMIGTVQEVKAVLDRIPEILDWRKDLPNAFYIISDHSAVYLANKIKAFCGKPGNFIVSEIGTNANGFLSPESWHLILKKTRKPI